MSKITKTNKTNNANNANATKIETAIFPVKHLLGAFHCLSNEEIQGKPTATLIYLKHQDGLNYAIASNAQNRLFFASHEAATEKMPDWLKEGVFVRSEGLLNKLLVVKNESSSDNPNAKLKLGDKSRWLHVSDEGDLSTFRIAIEEDLEAPKYFDVARDVTIKLASKESIFKPTSYNVATLEHVNKLGKLFRADKDSSIEIFSNPSNPDAKAIVVTFGCPNVVLYTSTPVSDDYKINVSINSATALLKNSVAALKAHKTRNIRALESAATDEDKAKYEEEVQKYDALIIERQTELANLVPDHIQAITDNTEKAEETATPEQEEVKTDEEETLDTSSQPELALETTGNPEIQKVEKPVKAAKISRVKAIKPVKSKVQAKVKRAA